MMLVMVLGTAIALLSCSKNNEDEVPNVKKSLIGAWKTSMSSSNWKTIFIKADGNLKYGYITKKDLEKYTYNEDDGTYYYYYVPEGESVGYGWSYDPSSNAYWAYDEVGQTISMFTKDGYYAFTYKVVMSEDNNSWAGIDAKGNTYSFVKIEE